MAPPLPRAVRRVVAELVIAERESRQPAFSSVDALPPRIGGFEDLAFLFSSTILAHGIASLRLDEAALLYRLVRERQPRVAVEIGRFRGGSTFLVAAALADGKLHSYDLDERHGFSGGELDRELTSALERVGLADKVELHVADSRAAPFPAPSIDFLFVDGDHREEAVRADLARWVPLLAPNGTLLLHDAVDAPDFVPPYEEGVARAIAVLDRELERQPAAGSIAHFVRRASA
jgi:predicted O-methyltransferase YrrM